MYYKLIVSTFNGEYLNNLSEKVKNLTFEEAKVDFYGEKRSLEKIRNNKRVEFEDMDLAKEINRIIQNIDDFPFLINDKNYIEPSAHFRSYLYEPGEYFKPHRDGASKEGSLKSKVTCLLYLNDTTGGETVLMPQGVAVKDAYIKISPKKGNILLFEHKIWHEGCPVSEGQKYVVRTDLMYESD